MKKIISLLLAIIMLLSITAGISISAYADTWWWLEDDSKFNISGDYEYTLLDDGTALITGYLGESTELSLPSELDGYTVTGIYQQTFEENESLVSVVIPNSITIIGNYAFNGCSNLANVEFGNSLTEIGQAAFQYCVSLKSITLPESVESVRNWAFYGCENLAEINLPENYTAIEGYATFDSTAYSSDKSNWEDGNLYIGEYLIHGSRDEEFYGDPYDYNGTVTIKEGTKYISPYAFSQYYASAFNDSIEKIIVPDSVTHIGYAAFGILHNLKTIELGSGVEYLGDGWVNAGFFDGIPTPESINVSEQNKTFSSIDGVLYNKDKTELLLWPAGKDVDVFVVPNTVKTIPGGLFSWQAGPDTIVLPSSVEKIGAFDCCYGVHNIYILNPKCDVSKMDFGVGETNNPEGGTIYGYTNSTAQKFAEENGNNFVAIDELKDSIIAEGTDETYVVGSKNGAAVHCTYPLDEFISVAVNGQLVDEANYTLAEGSTILTFKSEYLDTLPVSENVVALNFASGTVYSILTIEAPVIEEPTTEEPTTAEPTTKAPASESTTKAEATEKAEATTKAPKTEPTTEEPTTKAPATEAATKAETTKAEATTKPSTTEKVDTEKSPSTGAESKGLFALAAIALAGGAVMIVKKKEQD